MALLGKPKSKWDLYKHNLKELLCDLGKNLKL